MNSRFLPLGCLLLFSFFMLQPAASASHGRPDVLILVYALSTGQGQIGITYPGVVPHSQAQRDLQALQRATGWQIGDVRITDQSPPIQNTHMKMTGIEFTAKGALVPGSNTLAVEPFIDAFRAYHQIGLTYFVEQGFGFQGLRTYQDDYVQIAMTQHGSTYSYQIVVRDPHFGKLNLPRFQPSPGDTRLSGIFGKSIRSAHPWLVLLVVLAAIGAGAIVYCVLARQV